MARKAKGHGDGRSGITGSADRAPSPPSFLSPYDLNKCAKRAIWNIVPERRANVTLLTALLLPAFLGAAGLGVEASNWSVLRIELQRGVDVASQGAAMVYNSSGDARTGANAGADLMELNGLASGSRSWDSATNTLTEGQVTIKKVSGIRNASDTGFSVSVYKSVPLAFAKLFIGGSSMPISAQSWSELIPVASAQPCVLALSTSSSAVSLGGNASISGGGCAVRSNGGVSLNGNASITAAEIDAGGSITTAGNAAVHGTEDTNYGTIPDPYTSDTTVQNDIKALSAGSGSAQSVGSNNSLTLSPGTYSSISASGNASLTLKPGLYMVNGDVSFSGNAKVSAAGVTIVSSGKLSITGNGNVTWSAPGTTPTGSAVPGIAYVSNSNGAMAIGGNGTLLMTGVVYTPNAAATMAGNASYSGTACLELIVSTLTVNGNGTVGGSCSSMGALGFGSSTAATVALVQ